LRIMLMPPLLCARHEAGGGQVKAAWREITSGTWRVPLTLMFA
jgi:hypothetical protein